MTADAQIAIHADPVWREQSNYLIRVDLAPHRMSGGAEQLWTRTNDQLLHRLCCLPFFTYGLALGDTVRWDQASHTVAVVERSGRRLVRFAFQDPTDAGSRHESLHGRLVQTGCLMEFWAPGFGAIDCPSEVDVNRVLGVLNPVAERGELIWEWGDQPASDP